MKKKKLRIIISYVSIFFVIILLFAVSIFMFVSTSQINKVDQDLMLFKSAVQRVYDSELKVALPLNPKTITIVRGSDGRLDPEFPVTEFYRDGLSEIQDI